MLPPQAPNTVSNTVLQMCDGLQGAMVKCIYGSVTAQNSLTVELFDLKLRSSQVVLFTQHLGSVISIWQKRNQFKTTHTQMLTLESWLLVGTVAFVPCWFAERAALNPCWRNFP